MVGPSFFMTREELLDARDWLKECYHTEEDHEAIDQACDEDIERHIEREFDGGIECFLKTY